MCSSRDNVSGASIETFKWSKCGNAVLILFFSFIELISATAAVVLIGINTFGQIHSLKSQSGHPLRSIIGHFFPFIYLCALYICYVITGLIYPHLLTNWEQKFNRAFD